MRARTANESIIRLRETGVSLIRSEQGICEGTQRVSPEKLPRIDVSVVASNKYGECGWRIDSFVLTLETTLGRNDNGAPSDGDPRSDGERGFL